MGQRCQVLWYSVGLAGLSAVASLSAGPIWAAQMGEGYAVPTLTTPSSASPAPTPEAMEQAQALNDRGVTAARRGALGEAIALFQEAIALFPAYENAHNNLGIALGRQGRFAEAEAIFRQALAIDARNFETHNNLGIALASQGKYAPAAAAFRQAIALNPTDPEAYQHLGLALAYQGKVPEAIGQLEKAKQLYSVLGDVAEAQRIDRILQRARSAARSQ
ncbi:tetratricopeptide repeat protein [Trichothermofontia sp.]